MDGNDDAWEMYLEALRSDLEDIQGGTTAEGIHCGVMAGTVYSSLKLFGGLDVSGNIPSICPSLPPFWKGIKYEFSFRGTDFKVSVSSDKVELFARRDNKKKIKVHIYGEFFEIDSGERLSVIYNKGYKC